MDIKSKGLKEDFAKFFESPSRELLRKLLKNSVGEMTEIEFKEVWPEKSSLARHVLAIGNVGKGCIVIGVTDSDNEPKGINELSEKAHIFDRLKKYIPGGLLANLEIVDFSFSGSEYPKLIGKNFQVLFVEGHERHFPFLSLADGRDISGETIYTRRGPASVRANHDEIQRIINRRIETDYSSTRELALEEHLQHLKMLYTQIERNFVYFEKGSIKNFGDVFQKFVSGMDIKSKPNPKYPGEDFDDFIIRLINLKKIRIESELDVRGINFENS